MKDSQVDIASVVETTCKELEALKRTIRDELSVVSDEGVRDLINEFHTTVNSLVRHMNQSAKPLEERLKKSLVTLMHDIQKTPAFSQALGQHQVELMSLFKRINGAIQKSEKK